MTNESESHEVHEIDCLEAFDHLYAYLNKEITDPVDLANIEHHLSHCKSCFSRAQMERELNQRLKESGETEIPESLQHRLRNLMDKL
jgi:anti-sigma factor (TIGR02949 family)